MFFLMADDSGAGAAAARAAGAEVLALRWAPHGVRAW
jgi:beta-phosphoglucomutase-like phosphatase (HAD superfamily)